MTYKEYEIYKKISFVERYEKLSVKFQFEERLDYSKENANRNLKIVILSTDSGEKYLSNICEL